MFGAGDVRTQTAMDDRTALKVMVTS